MPWLSIPITNPFKSSLQFNDPQKHSSCNQNPSHDGGGGVKEDLSVLGETISRQLYGVAAFLAPPPSSAVAAAEDTSSGSSSQTLLGIQNDLLELGDSFKSGLSLLSSNKAVSGISRFASNLLPFQNNDDEDDDKSAEGVAGITEEVVDFARQISMRPEYWVEFPLSLVNDFNMSDVQREHTSTIDRLVPSVGALRLKLCSYMTDTHFWMIYFILILPRLNDHDSKLLSTPEIVEVREMVLEKLKNNMRACVNSADSNTVNSSLMETVSRVEIGEEENVEELLKEEYFDLGSRKQVENEEDEDKDFSSGWVQLYDQGGQELGGLSVYLEPNDWLTVDHFD